ncbi:carboxypeptidase regulatory-like domain-containing protein [Verrucosispora sp. WMMC514]|uniref:carboxypeptidase regulatory-like domain-containing protein n=1 Tax=Verrucosispora sp. WMMC514 TaxID=3015156 RepID=UPI00248D2E2E|nr:carboxypeptidase regulatory-like domain-containing protein [Verrucosispora sp. WMMC514]WBB93489.1 carboxypeptidase regulatory-like domain-containing protein [Verrucosispora sp. WMMC514]
MHIPLIRRAALACVTAAAVLLPGATPALAASTGTISGRLTTAAGAAAPDVPVVVYPSGEYDVLASTMTDADGAYTLPQLNPGSYTVGYLPDSRPEQYYRQQLRPWDADPVVVTAGATTTVDEQLLPTGTISGQLLDAAGEPVFDLRVLAIEADANLVASARTDENGRYEMDVVAGRYRVQFEPIEGSYQRQYVPGQVDEESATLFEVTEGARVVADDTVLSVGTLSGRFTTAAGAPLTNADVYVYTPNMYSVHSDGTSADGTFEAQLLAGTYKVGLYTNERHQYYPGQLESDQAELVTVRGGEQTAITDSLLGTGSVRISAVDSVTGAPVANFCAHDGCSNGSGRVTISDLTQGRHDIYVYAPDGRYFPRERTGVRVRADQTTELTIKLRPGAVITTTVLDRQSGSPVSGVCLDAFAPKRATLRDGYGNCSNRSGQVRVGPLTAGEYKLFAVPQNTTYGRQWVGAAGGTGDEREAATVTATVGQVATGPVIQLDRAGQVTGRVTDAETGAALPDVNVSVLTGHPGVGAEDAVTDDQGDYTLSRLGPYEWPVVFSRGGYATVWSGGAASRFSATPVQVGAGATANLDATLRRGVQLNGTFRNTEGTPLRSGWVLAHSVDTGDYAGSGWVSNGEFTMRLTGRQRIFFSYDVYFDDEQMYSGRYQVTDPDGTRRLARFTVPASGSMTADLVISTS